MVKAEEQGEPPYVEAVGVNQLLISSVGIIERNDISRAYGIVGLGICDETRHGVCELKEESLFSYSDVDEDAMTPQYSDTKSKHVEATGIQDLARPPSRAVLQKSCHTHALPTHEQACQDCEEGSYCGTLTASQINSDSDDSSDTSYDLNDYADRDAEDNDQMKLDEVYDGTVPSTVIPTVDNTYKGPDDEVKAHELDELDYMWKNGCPPKYRGMYVLVPDKRALIHRTDKGRTNMYNVHKSKLTSTSTPRNSPAEEAVYRGGTESTDIFKDGRKRYAPMMDFPYQANPFKRRKLRHFGNDASLETTELAVERARKMLAHEHLRARMGDTTLMRGESGAFTAYGSMDPFIGGPNVIAAYAGAASENAEAGWAMRLRERPTPSRRNFDSSDDEAIIRARGRSSSVSLPATRDTAERAGGRHPPSPQLQVGSPLA